MFQLIQMPNPKQRRKNCFILLCLCCCVCTVAINIAKKSKQPYLQPLQHSSVMDQSRPGEGVVCILHWIPCSVELSPSSDSSSPTVHWTGGMGQALTKSRVSDALEPAPAHSNPSTTRTRPKPDTNSILLLIVRINFSPAVWLVLSHVLINEHITIYIYWI